ncbi:MAG: RluA family pseudouridine synthase [Clostridiales bacterium]|nr:RluA family pseudouridine synthase [Clostridiales bacterium]
MQELKIVITARDDGKAVRQIALRTLSMSYAQFKRAKFRGVLLLDGEPVHADRRVKTGQTLVIRVPDAPAEPVAPFAIPLTVAYEDEDILIIDKPAPLPSVPSAKQAGMTLKNAVYAYLGAPEGFHYRPVNRLDRGTSGLMVVAKHAHAQQYLQRRLHSDDFIREYLAVCDGIPSDTRGVIDAPIVREDGAGIRRAVSAQGRPARTDYRAERIGNGRSLVRLRLFTGRTHQIRVHMQSIGCPVTGDFLYGTEHPLLERRFALHSTFLQLTTPHEKTIRLTSPPPDVFERLLSNQP